VSGRARTRTRGGGIARHHAGAVLLALAAMGCGPSLGPGAGLLDALFREPRVTQAREFAPDLIAAAEDARDAAARAHAAGDAEAADDETTRARLLLEAALVEVERAAAERTRRENERAAEADDEAARRDEEARTALAREAVWRAAARVAEAEQQRALARAQASEPRRGARLPSGDADDARDAARALARRARLLRAAAAALGATPAELAPVDVALTACDAALAAGARVRGAPIDALSAADEARRAAERALGTARDRAGAPGAEGTAALVETARLAGLHAQAEERGVVVYAAAFADRGRVPAQAAIGALATVLRAHASGPVLVAHEAPRDAAGARLARARVESLLRALVDAGTDAARLRPAPGDAPAPRDGEAPRAALVFPAYTTAARATSREVAPIAAPLGDASTPDR
jgi:chromosome segregation protein